MNTEPAAIPTAQDVTGSRIVAALIDVVILGVIYGVFVVIFGDSSGSSHSFSVSLGGLPALIYFLVVIAYYLVMEVQTGATVGKKVMGLKVVTVDGSPYSWGKAAIRNILRIVDGLPFLYLLGIIVIAVSKQKQRIGDMAAGTLVVKAQEPSI